MALCPELPASAGIRKVKPIKMLLKQETVSGSGISWAACKSLSLFTGQMPLLPPNQQHQSTEGSYALE